MMPVQSAPVPSAQQQQQQFLNGIAARLAQLAKDPPDLLVYLRAHAECVVNAFRPVGFAYEIHSGPGFQRLVHGNLESLGYRDGPEQENSFHRARNMAAEQRKPVLLAPQAKHSARTAVVAATDSPAPDELAVFNYTPYEQLFVPIPLGERSAGVLHIWFQPTNNAASHARLNLLRQFCGEIESYLKARRAIDASEDVTRLTTYSRLLEELTGDIDLDSVSWKLVNYAREAVVCERVCLFIARDYGHAAKTISAPSGLEYKFQLQACSGLKRPHPKSEQAVVLQHVAQKLAEMSLQKAPDITSVPVSAPEPIVNGAPAASASSAENGRAPAPAATAPTPPAPASAPPPLLQPKLQVTLMMRDPAKTATRAPEINDYFDVMPMNWATVIPLFDRDQRVCGIILFEGTKVEPKLSASFKPMTELAISAGKSIGTALYHSQNTSLRLARRLVAWRQEFVNTPARRRWVRYGTPFLIVACALCLPIPDSVKGNASVLPTKQTTLPALVSARLVEVDVREGEAVKKDQVLARFDTTDVQLQLSQAEQEYQRSLVESDAAMNAGNEAQMQISRLSAAKAAAVAEKLRLDLSRAVMRAPFDGLVLGAQTLSTRVGEVLRVGEAALAVVDASSWQVKANLKEQDLIFLDKRLRDRGVVPATLRLSANPAYKYQLELTKSSQLAYGLETTTGEYQFTAMLPFNGEIDNQSFLKAGFTGRIAFEAGVHPVAYVFFKDFVDYLKVRFF
ncbi:MAG TPA: biotin/lipoyl-binding protein [Opitutaceae bacterium]|nr:biotin/lipoyl-binding protein [Opitutaceae bacterium]